MPEVEEIERRMALAARKAGPFPPERQQALRARIDDLGRAEEYRFQWQLVYEAAEGDQRLQQVAVPIWDDLDRALKLAVRVFLTTEHYQGCTLQSIQAIWTLDHTENWEYHSLLLDDDVPFPVYRQILRNDWVRTRTGTHYKVTRVPYLDGEVWRFAGHLNRQPKVVVTPLVREIYRINELPFDYEGFLAEA